jgi:hypothetical protein
MPRTHRRSPLDPRHTAVWFPVTVTVSTHMLMYCDDILAPCRCRGVAVCRDAIQHTQPPHPAIRVPVERAVVAASTAVITRVVLASVSMRWPHCDCCSCCCSCWCGGVATTSHGRCEAFFVLCAPLRHPPSMAIIGSVVVRHTLQVPHPTGGGAVDRQRPATERSESPLRRVRRV